MVVDAQLDPAHIALILPGQHSRGSHIHCDQDGILGGYVHRQPPMEPGKPGRGLRIAQNVAGLAQSPQTQAQGGTAAQSIAVGAAVGQKAEVIVFRQETGCFKSRQCLHRG